MRRKQLKVTDRQIAIALELSGGVVLHAAETLGVHRNTIHLRMIRNPKLRKIALDCVEDNLDKCEHWIAKYIQEGDKDMIRFYLNNKGRSRGYSPRVDLGVPPNVEPPSIIDDIPICQPSTLAT